MKPQILPTENVNVSSFKPLIAPKEIKDKLPLGELALGTVSSARKVLTDILRGQDKRKFLIVGPCSIHDPESALQYAQKLQTLSRQVQESLFLIMRVYFEKPRTTVGWKGFINDPFLDNTFNMNEGLLRSRKLLLQINEIGLPVASEALEPISPQYIADLICWTAIGARTTESQTHRELASGLSSPVGFKNNTDGNIEVAINAMKSALLPHHFLGIDNEGRTSIVSTKGNPNCHLILRGGRGRPNYDSVSVGFAQRALKDVNLATSLVVDCSHDNSFQDYRNQPKVFEDCLGQITQGNQGIVGLMLESHLKEGKQSLKSNLEYGISITDGCLGWEKTEEIIFKAAERIKPIVS